MKNTRPKKLSKKINTICDYNTIDPASGVSDTGSGTDTTATLTIITTTINTHLQPKR